MKTGLFTNALLLTALALPMTALANAEPAPAEQPPEPEITRVEVEVDANGEVIVNQDGDQRVIVLQGGDHQELPPEVRALIEQINPAFNAAVAPEAEMVEAAYLGVNAEPLDFGTAEILGLAKGTGLAVGFVAEDSPAALAGLKKDDVLTRLNDQVLVNAEQLAVLIRTQKAGDAVTLHVLREGVPVELKAELVTKELPALGPGGANLTRQWQIQRGGPVMPGVEIFPGLFIGDGADLLPLNDGDGPVMPEEIREMIEQMRQQMLQQRIDIDRMMQQMREQLELDIEGLELNPLNENVEIELGKVNGMSEIVVADGEHKIAVRSNPEKRLITIKTAEGKVLFDGELPADNQIPGLDKHVQRKVDNLMLRMRFDFRQEVKPAAPEQEKPKEKEPAKPAPDQA